MKNGLPSSRAAASCVGDNERGGTPSSILIRVSVKQLAANKLGGFLGRVIYGGCFISRKQDLTVIRVHRLC